MAIKRISYAIVSISINDQKWGIYFNAGDIFNTGVMLVIIGIIYADTVGARRIMGIKCYPKVMYLMSVDP